MIIELIIHHLSMHLLIDLRIQAVLWILKTSQQRSMCLKAEHWKQVLWTTATSIYALSKRMMNLLIKGIFGYNFIFWYSYSVTNQEYYKKPKGVRTDNYIKLGSDGTGSKWINFLNNETSSNLDQDFVGSKLFKI